MKKINLALGLIGVGLLFQSTQAYTDIANNQYNYAIEELTKKGIVEGYDNNTFRPDNLINRAEFMKIITSSMPKLPPNQIENCIEDYTQSSWDDVFFPDVKKSEWYGKYVCTGKSRNVVNGYPDGDFKPANNVNYAEALKIIYQSNQDEGDTTATANWYSPYLEDAKANSIDLGINPSKEITRGEMAQLIVNYNTIKPYQEPTIDKSKFTTYTNEELGISFPLPKEFEDYVAVPVTYDFKECPGTFFLSINLIAPEAYENGARGYADLTIMEDEKYQYLQMPFDIYIVRYQDVCSKASRTIVAYDNCEENPSLCEMYLGRRHMKQGKYIYEFTPTYNEYSSTDGKNSFIFIPEEGELEYMRDNFTVLD